MARLRRVPISVELLQVWMTQGWEIGHKSKVVCEKGLPEGAQFVRSQPGRMQTDVVDLIFQHESFEDLPEGGDPPHLIPEYREYYDPNPRP